MTELELYIGYLTIEAVEYDNPQINWYDPEELKVDNTIQAG